MRRSAPRLPAVLACAAAVALLVGGCGIGSEEQAQPVDRDAVPFRLLDAEPASPSTSRPGEAAVLVYVVDEGEEALRPVVRGAPANAGPMDALQALVEGLTVDERAAGLRSLVPPETRVLRVTTRGTLVTVDLDGRFATGVSAADQGHAFAQIVYTVTQFEGLSRVAFRVQGEPIDVPRLDGTLTAGPVTRADYPQPG